ncbi:uncharacterized protein BP5553_04381 [Venustampulla echinocandica]|uniref:Uncharacterized protein n=1 Tax=Venustampulla echinocandica TaxID=2656787 RepID=A0A370TN61_9HELO|nr:uncharacterized protein BP5553_04381 [Venustampulla echinocandica]RDL36948.1 hypothetical protein BP5553_04381 [Venustampulla echinocandica]
MDDVIQVISSTVNALIASWQSHDHTSTRLLAMAPTSATDLLTKRLYYDCDADGYCRSTWNTWGRWVALAVIIVVFFLLALTLSCYNSRRRRRRGMAPMYGTGWMGGKPPTDQQYGNTNNYYPNQPYYGGAPAPPYSPPIPNQTTGTTFDSNHGYYGNQGIELQPPQSSYQPQRGGDPVYEAPQGPPPRKEGDIIR